MKSKEQIVKLMLSEAPFEIPGAALNYIYEAMDIYAKEVARKSLEIAAESHQAIEPEYTHRDVIENEDNIVLVEYPCPDCGIELQRNAFGDSEWCNSCGYSYYV